MPPELAAWGRPACNDLLLAPLPTLQVQVPRSPGARTSAPSSAFVRRPERASVAHDDCGWPNAVTCVDEIDLVRFTILAYLNTVVNTFAG